LAKSRKTFLPLISGSWSFSSALSTAPESSICSMADRGVLVSTREEQPIAKSSSDPVKAARLTGCPPNLYLQRQITTKYA